jgi:hypothetical protein
VRALGRTETCEECGIETQTTNGFDMSNTAFWLQALPTVIIILAWYGQWRGWW